MRGNCANYFAMTRDHSVPEGTPAEAYSRVTNPERFACLHGIAAAVADRLALRFRIERAEGYGLDPELESGLTLARPTVKLRPQDRRAYRSSLLNLPWAARSFRALVSNRIPTLRLRCLQ